MQYKWKLWLNILFSILAALPKGISTIIVLLKKPDARSLSVFLAEDSFDKFVIEVERNPVSKIVQPK